MRFALDIVWLDREGTVLAVQRGGVRPWRFAIAPRAGTLAVLEVAGGRGQQSDSSRRTRAACSPGCHELRPLPARHCLRELG